MAEEQQVPGMTFNIDKIYVKDLSVEVPNAPSIYLAREAPEIEVDLATENTPLGEDRYESVIRVTVTAKKGDKTFFLVECAQAGIFHIAGLPQEQIPLALGIGCPNIIFPYVRETVSDVILRAGFPPLQLAPFNFEAEFMRQQQEASQATGAAH